MADGYKNPDLTIIIIRISQKTNICRRILIWRSWDRALLMYVFKYNQQDTTL